MATIVAVEHTPNKRERHGDRDIDVAPSQPREREERDGEDRPDQQAGDELATNNRSDGNTDREAADHERLGLGADGVGHVHDAGDEERQCYLCLEFTLEGADNRRGDHRAGQPDQQPGQAVPEAPPHPFGTGSACRSGIVDEAAEAGHVLVVLGEEHAEKTVRGNEPSKPAFVVDDRETRLAADRGRATPPVPGRGREVPLAGSGP